MGSEFPVRLTATVSLKSILEAMRDNSWQIDEFELFDFYKDTIDEFFTPAMKDDLIKHLQQAVTTAKSEDIIARLKSEDKADESKDEYELPF